MLKTYKPEPVEYDIKLIIKLNLTVSTNSRITETVDSILTTCISYYNFSPCKRIHYYHATF